MPKAPAKPALKSKKPDVSDPNAPVSAIKNMGPAGDEGYARAGITKARQIIDMGPDEAYYLYLRHGGFAHFIGYYALVMGLMGRTWNAATGPEKDALRLRFDAIRARIKADGVIAPKTATKALQALSADELKIEAFLNDIGVGTKR